MALEVMKTYFVSKLFEEHGEIIEINKTVKILGEYDPMFEKTEFDSIVNEYQRLKGVELYDINVETLNQLIDDVNALNRRIIAYKRSCGDANVKSWDIENEKINNLNDSMYILIIITSISLGLIAIPLLHKIVCTFLYMLITYFIPSDTSFAISKSMPYNTGKRHKLSTPEGVR